MIFSTILAMAVSVASQSAASTPVIDPFQESARCPETPMSLARKNGTRPMRAIPLTEAPNGQMFMAVDRRVDGCSAPLTAVEYRRSSGKKR